MLLINDEAKKLNYIKNYDLNRYFSKDMSTYMNLYKCDINEFICLCGEESKSLLFLVEGKFRVSISRGNGKTLLLRFGMPPFVIGDLEFTLGNTFDCNIQCTEPCYLVSISYKTIHTHCDDDSVFWKAISKNLALKMHISSTANSINLLYPLENRIASYLIATSEHNDNKALLDMRTSKLTDIADLLGTTYRHLARTLNSLCERGIISRNGKAIVIEDSEMLKDLAGDIYE